MNKILDKLSQMSGALKTKFGITAYSMMAKRLGLVMVLLVSYNYFVQAANKTFLGSGIFSDATKWNLGVLPVAGDVLWIDGTCTFDNAANGALVYGSIDVGHTIAGTLNWSGGSNTLQVTGISSTKAGSTIDMTNGGTLQLTGAWAIANQTFTAGSGTIIYNAAAGGQTVIALTYNTLTLGNTSGTQTASGAIITTTLNNNTNPANIFNMGTFALTGVTTLNNTGTIRTQNISATPLPTGLTWGGTVKYDAVIGTQTLMAGTYATLTMGNTSGTQTASGAIVATTLNNNTNAADVLNMGTFALTGVTTANNTGTIRTQNISATPLPNGLIWGGTIKYDALTGAQTAMAGTYATLTMGNTSGTQTASGAIITTTLNNNTNPADIFNMGTFVLTGVTTANNTGTIRTQNISVTPLPTGLIWGGTVAYDAATGTQTLMAGTYATLTLGNTSGTNTAGGDIIVGGTLTLAAGTFTIGANTLTLNGSTIAGTPANLLTSVSSNLVFGGSTAGVLIPTSILALNNLSISNTGIVALQSSPTINGTFDPQGAGLSIGANTLTLNGQLNCGKLTGSATSNIIINGAGTAALSAVTLGNLTINRASGVALCGNVTANGTLTLTSGVFQLGTFDLTLANTTAIAGSPFSVTNMVETNGAGHLIRSANATNILFNLTYPVGSSGYYSPLIVSGLTSVAGGAKTFKVRAVPTNPGVLTNAINRYWELSQTAMNLTGINLSFTYNAGEVTGDPLLFLPYTNTSGTWLVATGPSLAGANPATSTGSASINGNWTVGAPSIFYSYQTGDWNQATTWTFDPGGTTGPGSLVPGMNDAVVILSGRTVTLSTDVATQFLDITINNGGTLDQSTRQFSSGLIALRGDGTLKLSSSNFPNVVPAVNNTFVTADGGTTEYNAGGNMSATQLTYYHLNIKTAGTVIQGKSLTLNGDLHVKQGTFQINDGTAQRLKLFVSGNVTVDAPGSITVGTGNTINGADVPTTNNNGGIAPFINYYDQETHRVVIKGDFINNGSVRFTNQAFPQYDAFPVNGATSVFFQGLKDNVLTCKGTTDFYNLIVDKGIDQTFKLTLYSDAYNHFRLFGANVAPYDLTSPVTAADNPNLKKALWIRNGSLVLQGLTVIPSLTEGVTAAAPSTDYFIPKNGAMVLDGTGVIVLSTADDFSEVNAAYGALPGGTNVSEGIYNGNNGGSGLSVSGKLQMNNGYLSTRESSGLLYWSYAPGQIIVNGGMLDTKQLHNPEGTNVGLVSYTQIGGNVIVRGRFQNTISYINPADLANALINTARAANGIDATSGIGAFSINSNASNVFTMAGGTLSVYDVCNTTATPFAFLVNSPASNNNVTGGTVQFIPTTGTGLADANFLINSLVPFGNLTVNRVSGASIVQLNTNPLNVLQNLTLQSGTLDANNLDVTIGGNFSIAAGTTYTAGTNNTIFNSTNTQAFTVNLAAALTINNLQINKNAGIALAFAGAQNTVNINNLTLSGGILNDNGNTINVSGNIINSGIHQGTGKIVLIGTNPQTIGGNNSGIFNNLDLNSTNAASAPVSLTANITIAGILNLVSNKIFNIANNNLNITATGSIPTAGCSITSFIQTNGQVGDGGITKTYSSTAAFTFPVGAYSTKRPATYDYTPATIGFSVAPSAYGSITVNPVGTEQPNTTTKNISLTYYWHVKSSGFTLSPNSVNHSYVYSQTDVNSIETNYVPARYNYSNFSWTNGTTASINTVSNTIGLGVGDPFMSNANAIDGDYTAGNNNPTNPFGVPKIYYSRQTGLWSNANSWSLVSHSGAAAGTVPGAADIVLIGGNDSIYLATNNTIVNTDIRSCASLQIEGGSALDIGYNPGCTFSVVSSNSTSALGNGNFRLTTSWNSGSTFTFPSGDFSDFNQKLGTTELYSTNPVAGTTYWLPQGILSYGNLILSPVGGSNIIFANNNLTIFGNLITRGQNADSWFCPSWNSAYPTAPAAVVAKTITINGSMLIQSGALIWYGNGAIAQNFVVNGDVVVSPWGAIQNGGGGATNQSMAIGGSLINNTNNATQAGVGTVSYVDFSTNGVIPVTFFGPNNAFITNTAGTPRTVFSTLNINKGSSQSTSLTCNIGGTLTTPNDNWLTLQNGTFIYNHTGNFDITKGSPFNIPATSGLTINTPSNVYLANSGVNTNDVYLSGKLTLISGNLFVGPMPSVAFNNDIEYSSGGASTIDVQGGNLVVNGQIRRNPGNAAGILNYSQSGSSVVTINGQNANNTNAKLEVVNNGSQFNMSGTSTLTIVRGNGATITPSSPFGDLYIKPQTSSITGGNIVFSQASTTQNYFLDVNVPLNNLTITGGVQGTVRLLVSPLTVNGDMTISTNSILNTNNINVTFNGNLINNVGIGGYVSGANLTTFRASGTQSITGATNFYDLLVNPGTSLTLNNPSTIANTLTTSSGTFICGANLVTVKGDVSINGRYTTDNINGGVSLQGTTKQLLSGSQPYGRLELKNLNGAKIGENILLKEDLVLTQGILDINKYMLTLDNGSSLKGAPFSATKMITSDGVYSNVGMKKFFNIGANPAFEYPIGTAGKYTPAVLTLTANASAGFIRLNNINSRHPAVIDPTNVLDYYWEVESSGPTGVTGTLLFNYLQGDVLGSQETSWLTTRLIVPPSTSWSKGGGVVDPILNKLTFNYGPVPINNLSGEYSAGIGAAFPDDVPIYTSNKDGNWTDNTIWDQTGGSPYPCPAGGPNGFIVIINHVITANANNCMAYAATINNKLKIVSPFSGHSLLKIDGSGTLYLEGGKAPDGDYSKFLDCTNNGTIEYGGSGIDYTILPDIYNNVSNVPNVLLSGTGTRTWPNKDLTICKSLKINGPILDNTGNSHLTIQGSMERYGTGAFLSGTSTVTFAGSGYQTIGGALGDFNGSNAFYNFEMNNPDSLVINTGGAIEVNGNLLLTNGLIKTQTNNSLTITNTNINCVVPAGGSATSFVNGPLVKKINQGDNFLFPIGFRSNSMSSKPGNRLSLSATQVGTVLWSAEYKSPNSTYTSLTLPLQGASQQEYWTVKAPAGKQAIININWNPLSDVTPLITPQTDIRIAQNTGSWTQISTNSVGDNFNGTATTAGLVTSTGTNDYTLASVSLLKPRAKFNPAGPVCVGSGIPVSFTTPFAISFNYSLSYTIGGTAQLPVTVSSTPYWLATPSPGNYVLTGYTYNNGVGVGVFDATPVAVNLVPTNSVAGPDQSMCGISTANLAANTPTIGVGTWSIFSGTGGTVLTPGSPTSQFIGINGNSYKLRWTISSGTCTSFSDVNINFTLLPNPPTAPASQSFCAGSSVSNLAGTAPGGSTLYWFSNLLGGVALTGGTALSTGNYYGESNGGGGCISLTRKLVAVTVNPLPTPTFTAQPGASACASTDVNYTTQAGQLNYFWTFSGVLGTDYTITSGGGATDNSVTLKWLTTGSKTVTINYKNASGCAAVSATLSTATTITPLPITGPLYRKPNN